MNVAPTFSREVPYKSKTVEPISNANGHLTMSSKCGFNSMYLLKTQQNQGHLCGSNALKGAQFTVLKTIKNSFPGENLWVR